MRFTKFLLCSFLLFTISLNYQKVFCQTSDNSLQNEQMKQLMKQFTDYTNTNKNAQALDVLQRYAILQDIKFAKEKDSAIKQLQNDFINSRKSRLADISEREKEITELKAGNEDIDKENLKMTRNTLLFFGILVGMAVLILLNRFRALASVKEKLELSNSYLNYVQNFTEKSVNEKTIANNLKHSIQKAKDEMQAASTWLNLVASDKQNAIHKQAAQLIQNTNKAIAVLEHESNEEPGIKVNTDLNQLIDEVIDQAFQYTSTEIPEFSCTIVRDLEKILPKVEVIPEDIRNVIFNLLTNAFESVHEKKSNAPKGYQPKVSITTRKLPRFVQIRIKDNGTGINEKDPKNILNPFYTTKKSERNTGLGLSESARIINVAHKGELIIESDPANGSDFIIRFTTLTLS